MQLINKDSLDLICGAGGPAPIDWAAQNALARLIEEINARNANTQPPSNTNGGW
jgi:hypothetical protein